MLYRSKYAVQYAVLGLRDLSLNTQLDKKACWLTFTYLQVKSTSMSCYEAREGCKPLWIWTGGERQGISE